MRDTILLNAVVEDIANREGRVDGLIAAAAIQQETPALEYSAKDSNALLEVNVTGVFMTAQAVARQMVRFGNGGSIVLVASMSGTVVNRVGCFLFLSFYLYSIFLSSFLSILLSFFFFFFFSSPGFLPKFRISSSSLYHHSYPTDIITNANRA